MSSSKNRNLILSIHIDSSDINLAAGYVDKEKVNLLALKKGHLAGINFGNIINKELFTNSVINNLQDFIDNHLRVYSESTAKNLGLKTVDGKLVIKKVAYNIIVSEVRKLDTIQTHLVKQILKDNFFAKDVVLSAENIFECTADTATTTLLVDDDNANKPYMININLCYNSAWINFITNTSETSVYSRSIEKGFKEIVTSINASPRIKSPLSSEQVYNGLKGYRFLVNRASVDFKISLFRAHFYLSEIENAIVLRLQELFHLCYDKFKELDRNGLRFKADFLDKVQINFMGYGSDLLDVDAVAALVFSERLADEQTYLKSEKEKNAKITSNHSQVGETLDLTTGMHYYQNSYLPSVNVRAKELIYFTHDAQITFAHHSLKVQAVANPIVDVCFSFSQMMAPQSVSSYREYINNLDQFATSLGLIYNYHLAQPKPVKKGLIDYLLNLLKL
ncbi:hypothetical protein [Psittacicella hinzii]|uniref:Uncharacterized protein n=1 Tax=Psittacicella hinzii TaxID=2028575 RepID=A0A3A1YNY7_9GAMM|nr:hypothetical protein [Psittacicella hinzii]RIY38670.1 hypothetical protein CKF58_03695 [Psittacicella hinzii]